MDNPFDLRDAVIRDLPYVQVTRHAPHNGRMCEYRKLFKPEGLGEAEYWLQRENEFLLDFTLKRLRHTVELAAFVQGGANSHTPTVEFVATRDAGLTIEDWLRVQPRYDDGLVLRHPFQPAGQFLRLLRACMMALREIHEHGIVHCDIKEDNICLPSRPYPPETDRPLAVDFERIRLIDFAFAVTPERPLAHPLPILPVAPYQSGLLKSALLSDQSGRGRNGWSAQQLDYRVDLYSLGHMAARILNVGLVPPQGAAGLEILRYCNELVERLKAFDKAKRERKLPHEALISDIDAWLAADTSGKPFAIAQIRQAALSSGHDPLHGVGPTPTTPLAEPRPDTALPATPIAATPLWQGQANPPEEPLWQAPSQPNQPLYAGFWKRAAALMIDGIVLGFASFLIHLTLGVGLGLTRLGDAETSVAILSAGSGFLLNWFYYAGLESATHQATLGKLALGLQVVDCRGRRVSFWRASGRQFGKLLSALSLMVGYAMAGFTERKQALHDKLAQCLVVNQSALATVTNADEASTREARPKLWAGFAAAWALLIVGFMIAAYYELKPAHVPSQWMPENPPQPSPPRPLAKPKPPTAQKDEDASEQARLKRQRELPVQAVLNYYQAMGRQDVEAALGQWKNPSNKAATAQLIRNIESAQVKTASLQALAADSASVQVDVVVKAFNKPAEDWQGTIDLEQIDENRWGIVRMNLSPAAASTPNPAAEPPAVVRAYFAALEQHDVDQAAALRKSVPNGFDGIVANVEYYRLSESRSQGVEGDSAKVWVDLVSKDRKSGPQHWRGTVELQLIAGNWVIASLKNLTEVP
jgi:uncharacterized RDD family membrane protein YckC